MHLQLHISFLSVQESELLFQGSFQNSGLKHSTSGANQSQRLIEKKRYMKVRWGFNLESQGDLCPYSQMAPRFLQVFFAFPRYIHSISFHFSIITLFHMHCCSSLCSFFNSTKILVSIAGCAASSYKCITSHLISDFCLSVLNTPLAEQRLPINSDSSSPPLIN